MLRTESPTGVILTGSMGEIAAIAETAELHRCPGAESAVIAVHGIGVQEAGSTVDTYGGALEHFWNNFGDRRAHYSSWRCDSGHIHLAGGSSSILIDEAHWDDVVHGPPSGFALFRWLLGAIPIGLVFGCKLPPWTGGPWARYLAFSRWMRRVMFLLYGIILLYALLLVVWPIAALVGWHDGAARARRKMMLTIGDAYLFQRRPDVTRRMQRRLVVRAHQLSADARRLVIVAHSQGGAVTLDAIQDPSWPEIDTHVVTLGSGHHRLYTLREMRRTTTRRLATWAWLVLMLTAVLACGEAAASLAADDPTADTLGGLVLACAFGFCAPVFYWMWRSGRQIRRGVRHASSWLDVWASHDLVPDGPVKSSQNPTLGVDNLRSVLRDHTTYHLNAPGVVAPIVATIDPTRIAGHHDLIHELVAERRRRLRGFARFFLLDGWRIRVKPENTLITAAEFRGISLRSRRQGPPPAPSRRISPPRAAVR